MVNLSKGEQGGGGLHGIATKARFPEWIPWVHINMDWEMIGALRREVGDDAKLKAVVLDLKEAYRSFDVSQGQRILTMLRVWVFASEDDADKPSKERELVLKYVKDLAAAFGLRASGYADYELVVGVIWALERVFLSVNVIAAAAVATDDFIAISQGHDAEAVRALVRMVLELSGFGVEGKSHADIVGALDVPRGRTVWIGWGLDVNAETGWLPVYRAKVEPMYAAWGREETTASARVLESLQGIGFWIANFCPGLAPFLSSFIASKERVGSFRRERCEDGRTGRRQPRSCAVGGERGVPVDAGAADEAGGAQRRAEGGRDGADNGRHEGERPAGGRVTGDPGRVWHLVQRIFRAGTVPGGSHRTGNEQSQRVGRQLAVGDARALGGVDHDAAAVAKLGAATHGEGVERQRQPSDGWADREGEGTTRVRQRLPVVHERGVPGDGGGHHRGGGRGAGGKQRLHIRRLTLSVNRGGEEGAGRVEAVYGGDRGTPHV